MELPSALAQAIQKLRTRTAANARRSKADKKNLDDAIKAIHKTFGKESISPLVNLGSVRVPSITTGVQAIDDILTGVVEWVDGVPNLLVGTGRGMPRGRIVEVFGPESGGKTTLCLVLCAAFQEQGYTVAYIDAEHAVDFEYAARLGCDIESWLYSQPSSAEEALQIVDELTKRDAVQLIVVDSVAALTPQIELDEPDLRKQHMGVHARLMSKSLRKLTARLKPTSPTVMFVNQTRQKIGIMFGNPETTPGGNALRFYASIRMRVSKVSELKSKSKGIGIRTKIRTVKNKVAVPFREVFADIVGGRGITATHSKSTGSGSSSKDEGGDDSDD